MKLSYRDKIILMIFVLLMTLFVGIFTLVKPKSATISDSKQVLSEKRDEKEKVDKEINSLVQLRVNNTTENKKIAELNKFFVPIMNTSEIDKYVYAIAKDNGISIDSLELIPPQESDLFFYNPLIADNENTLKVKANCATANITCRVAKQQYLKDFLDAIDNLETSVIVDSCSIIYNEENNNYDVNISVSFYTVDKDEKIES